jgi:uncharacterized membrane protein
MAESEVPSNNLKTPFRAEVLHLERLVRAWIEASFGWLKIRFSSKWVLALVACFSLYVFFWSEISIDRIRALLALTYDFGIGMENGWLVVHNNWTPAFFAADFLRSGDVFILLPFTLTGNYEFVAVIQALILASATFPIYGIAKHILKDELTAFCIAASYLVYFPLAGTNWYDFHSEILFIPFFLMGYFCYIKGYNRRYFAFMLLSALTIFPYGILPFIFSGCVLLEALILQRRNGLKEFVSRNRWTLALALASGILLVTAYFLVIHAFFSVEGTFGPIGEEIGSQVSANLLNKSITIILIFAPVAFLPLISIRWLPLMAPYFVLVFGGNNLPFQYPYFFFFQYQNVVGAFVFLGLIDAIAVLRSKRRPSRKQNTRQVVARRTPFRGRRAAALTVFSLCLATALLFEPYGPLNQYSPGDFDLQANMNVNETFYNEAMTLIGLIPRSDPFVLFQDNLPEVLPRPLVYNNSPLVPGLQFFGPNLTVESALSDSFPININNHWTSVKIDYALADPESYLYHITKRVLEPNGTIADGPSMFDFIHVMFESGMYGLLGEASGMILLERGYTGSPRYYVPETSWYPTTSLHNNAGTPFTTGTISITNGSGNVPVWQGPGAYVSPGLYRLTYILETSNNSPENHLLYQVLAGPTAQTIIDQGSITGRNFSDTYAWTAISFDVYVNNAYDSVQFIIRATEWNGTLTSRGLYFSQLAPGNPEELYLGFNPALVAELKAEISLIPSSASGILFQDDLPIPYYPAVSVFGEYLVPGVATFATNVTPEEALLDQFPLEVEGQRKDVEIDYVLAIPSLSSYTQSNPSMFDFVEAMISSGAYGILAEASGMLLLERNFTGSPEYFIPENQTYPVSALHNNQGIPLTGSMVSITNGSGNVPMWQGPGISIAPGDYKVAYSLEAANVSGTQALLLQVLAGANAQTVLGSLTITGTNFAGSSQWVSLDLAFRANNTYGTVQFIVRVTHWNGTLSSTGVQLIETGPPGD